MPQGTVSAVPCGPNRGAKLLAGAEGVLLDHPLLLRRQIDALVVDVLVLGGDAQDFERFLRRAFKPVFVAARD
jgi:hypothetical protein